MQDFKFSSLAILATLYPQVASGCYVGCIPVEQMSITAECLRQAGHNPLNHSKQFARASTFQCRFIMSALLNSLVQFSRHWQLVGELGL